MKKRVFFLLVALIWGSQSITYSADKYSESYQRWIYWYSNDSTIQNINHKGIIQEYADVMSAMYRGEISPNVRYKLSTGIFFQIPQPDLYLEYLEMCIQKADPRVKTPEDAVNAILNGDEVVWGNDISCKTKNYYFSTKHKEVRFIGNYDGSIKAVDFITVNGIPTIKKDCGNPNEVYGDGYVPTYTTAVKVPDTVITTYVNGEAQTETIYVVIFLEERESIPPQQVVYVDRPCYDCQPTFSFQWCFNPINMSCPPLIPMGGYANNTHYCNSGGNVIDNSTYIDNSSYYYNYEDNDVVIINNPPAPKPNPEPGPAPVPPHDDEDGQPAPAPPHDDKSAGEQGNKVTTEGNKSLNENQATAKATTQPQSKQPVETSEVTSKNVTLQTTTGGGLTKEKLKTVTPTTRSDSPVEGKLTEKPSTGTGGTATRSTTTVPSTKPSEAGGTAIRSTAPSTKPVNTGGEFTRTTSTPTSGTATRQVATAQSTVKNPSSKVVQPVASARSTSEGGGATRKIYTTPSSKPPTSTQSSRSTQPSQQGSNQSYSAPANSREGSHSSPSKKASSVEQSRQKPSYSQPSRSYSKPQQPAGRNNYYSGQSGSSGGGKTRSGSSPNSGYSGGGKSRSPGNSGGGGASRSGGSSPKSGGSRGSGRPH